MEKNLFSQLREGVQSKYGLQVKEWIATYISWIGWEGSTHDTRVLLYSINTPSLNFPKPPQGIVIFNVFCA